MSTSAKTLNAFECIENKVSQIRTLSIMAQDSHMEELSAENIGHFFTVIIELTRDISKNLATLDLEPIKEQ